jgi:hypothetical protein
MQPVFNLFRTKQTFSKQALYAYTNIKFDIQYSALSIIKLDALAKLGFAELSIPMESLMPSVTL